MILKIQALIYRYTGIFLAHKAENKEIWDFLRENKNEKITRLSLSLHIGMWQATKGFTTFFCPISNNMVKLRYSRFSFLVTVFWHIELFLRQAYWDLFERWVYKFYKAKKLERLFEAAEKNNKRMEGKNGKRKKSGSKRNKSNGL